MRILVCLLAGLGDAIMTSPTIRAIRQAHPDWTIHAITAMRATNAYAEALPELDRVDHEDFLDFPAQTKFQKLLRLRRRDYDYTILPYPSSRWQYHAGSLVMATGTLISHTYGALHRLVPGYAYSTPAAKHTHAVDLNARLLQGLGISTEIDRSYSPPSKWSLPPRSQRRRVAFHLMSFDSRINKGNEHKSPPLAAYAAVARRLAANGYEIAAVGTANEREIADEFASLVEAPVGFITGSLEDTARGLRDGALLVSGDSGIAHLAASIDVPVVCVFGPTDPAQSGPIGREVAIVRPSDCPPCFLLSDPRFTCKLDIDFACVREHLTPNHIFEAAAKRLGIADQASVRLTPVMPNPLEPFTGIASSNSASA